LLVVEANDILLAGVKLSNELLNFETELACMLLGHIAELAFPQGKSIPANLNRSSDDVRHLHALVVKDVMLHS